MNGMERLKSVPCRKTIFFLFCSKLRIMKISRILAPFIPDFLALPFVAKTWGRGDKSNMLCPEPAVAWDGEGSNISDWVEHLVRKTWNKSTIAAYESFRSHKS